MKLKDYKSLKFSERRELDRKAYEKYFQAQNFECEEVSDRFLIFSKKTDLSSIDTSWIPTLSFNQFYGTEVHKRYLVPFLRKLKLEQIKKVSE